VIMYRPNPTVRAKTNSVDKLYASSVSLISSARAFVFTLRDDKDGTVLRVLSMRYFSDR
jgi:hypothetical protein